MYDVYAFDVYTHDVYVNEMYAYDIMRMTSCILHVSICVCV